MRIQTSCAAAVIAVMFGSVAAQAADLYTPPPPAPIEVDVFSWSTCYIGAQGGPGWSDSDVKFPYSDNSTSPDGFLIGGRAGCDMQLDQFGSFVLGALVDGSYADINDKTSYPAGPVTATYKTDINYAINIRARAGFALDRILFYGTGGLAIGNVEGELSTAFASDKDSKTLTGWVAGGGVEWAVTDNISVFGEYLYSDFGSKKFSYGGALTAQSYKQSVDLQSVLFGVNYRF
ncbi:outer membrane immunogenic protein [Rhodoligotrophos appendicifer]|uniref:outer membrane protein n=1 Tax=Rhodoligotrophos appendicifer TaxID=987056 RepID=UPI0011862D94|nr:outer membrane protein [Rhodoligotrophos appendicifer]